MKEIKSIETESGIEYSAILETIRNQFGDEIISSELVFFIGGEGDFYAKLVELNCSNSIELGLGTCNCVSHDAYRSETIYSRTKVREMLNNSGIDYPNEIEGFLVKENPLDYMNEDWRYFLQSSYAVGFNPLPHLRGFLKERGFNCSVQFRFSLAAPADRWNDGRIDLQHDPEDNILWVVLDK